MEKSVLDTSMEMRLIISLNHGHSSYISRNVALSSSFWSQPVKRRNKVFLMKEWIPRMKIRIKYNGNYESLTSELSPAPTPSQAERCIRVWAHAKVHGMALRLSTPPFGLRLAGRLPMFNIPSSNFRCFPSNKYIQDDIVINKNVFRGKQEMY